ncbi:MAG: hypothetical protein ACXABY_09180 [Candidatus Thorarchaeota archaeon]|jgi:hypothetical protein
MSERSERYICSGCECEYPMPPWRVVDTPDDMNCASNFYCKECAEQSEEEEPCDCACHQPIVKYAHDCCECWK